MKNIVLGLGLALASMGLLVGCGGGGSSYSPRDPHLRFVNAISDSAGLDFYLNNDRKATNIAFPSSTANFQSVSVADYDVSIRDTGSSTDLWSESRTLSSNRDYLVLGLGLSNYGTELAKRPQLLTIDANLSVPNGSKSRLIVVNAYNRKTGFETPSIDFRNPGDTPLFSATDIAYGTSKVLEVDSGVLTFQARRNGTEQVYVEKSLNLGSGKVYLVLLSGVEEGTALQTPDIKLIELQVRN